MDDTGLEPRRPSAREARHFGFPAVLGHEVVAVACEAHEGGPGRVLLIRLAGRGDPAAPAATAEATAMAGTTAEPEVTETALPTDRLYVWARAGRLTFGAADGATIHLTLLGTDEAEGMELGAAWPRAHSRSRAANIAHGAVADLKNAVTFPSSFPRMMRTSGERNAVLDAVVGFCQREIPGVHVLRGWPRSAEGPAEGQYAALPHKGLIGEHGWLADTKGVGADQETWAEPRKR